MPQGPDSSDCEKFYHLTKFKSVAGGRFRTLRRLFKPANANLTILVAMQKSGLIERSVLLAQCVYAPAFWLGFIGLATWLVACAQSPLWSLVPLGFVAIGVSFAAERILPYDAKWNGIQADTGRDVAHATINELSNAFGIAAWVGLLALVQPLPSVQWWPHHWPIWLQLVAAILIADAGFTLCHWASHHVEVLWRLHAVHHSVQRMYGFNGLLKHPLHQAIEATAALGPLLLLGLPQTMAALLGFAAVIQLLLQHSNVDMRLGPLHYVFAFAPVHRFHHMRYGKSGDVNFGFFFNFWDYILGTAFYTDRYRMATKDLGIGSRPDFPETYVEHLKAPFVWSSPTQPAPETPLELRRG